MLSRYIRDEKNMKNYKKGFTLIELLVVVAIIGILASVVLASLNSARTKGSDAAIKANLSNMRAQAAMYYDTNSKYNVTAGTAVTCSVAVDGTATGCTGLFADTTILAALKAAAAASGAAAIGNTDTTGAYWAASATLKTTADGNFCVDVAGAAKKNSTSTAGVCS